MCTRILWNDNKVAVVTSRTTDWPDPTEPVPFGAPYSEFGVYDTEYRTVCDLTNLCYYFELTTAPNVIWTELGNLDFEPGAPVITLDPDDIDLVGEVSGAFRQARPPTEYRHRRFPGAYGLTPVTQEEGTGPARGGRDEGPGGNLGGS